MNQILLGVSTRGYEASLEPRPPRVRARGSSKSSASRSLVTKTRERLSASLERRLDDLDLMVLLMDGIKVARQTVVVALGSVIGTLREPATPGAPRLHFA